MKVIRGGGFTYLEVLVAAALFAICVLPVIPAVGKAAQDMRHARDGYRAQMLAVEVMLAARYAWDSGAAFPEAELDPGGFTYGYWVTGTDVSYVSPGAPGTPPSVVWDAPPGISMPSGVSAPGEAGRVLAVAVWLPDGTLAGRAACAVYG